MIYKGIFWLIEGELYTKKLECDKLGNVIGDGSGLNSKSGDNFNHRLTWEGLPKNVTHGKEYNYYPRGRVEIKGGKAVIYLNPALNSEEMLAELTRLFGLDRIAVCALQCCYVIGADFNLCLNLGNQVIGVSDSDCCR